MVDVAMKLQTQGERLKERVGRIRVPAKRPGIRVEPANEDLRRVLRHIPSGVRFRSEGSIEWPDDTFTRRRLKDGSVKLVEKQDESCQQLEQATEQQSEQAVEQQPEPRTQTRPRSR